MFRSTLADREFRMGLFLMCCKKEENNGTRDISSSNHPAHPPPNISVLSQQTNDPIGKATPDLTRTSSVPHEDIVPHVPGAVQSESEQILHSAPVKTTSKSPYRPSLSERPSGPYNFIGLVDSYNSRGLLNMFQGHSSSRRDSSFTENPEVDLSRTMETCSEACRECEWEYQNVFENKIISQEVTSERRMLCPPSSLWYATVDKAIQKNSARDAWNRADSRANDGDMVEENSGIISDCISVDQNSRETAVEYVPMLTYPSAKHTVVPRADVAILSTEQSEGDEQTLNLKDDGQVARADDRWNDGDDESLEDSSDDGYLKPVSHLEQRRKNRGSKHGTYLTPAAPCLEELFKERTASSGDVLSHPGQKKGTEELVPSEPTVHPAKKSTFPAKVRDSGELRFYHPIRRPLVMCTLPTIPHDIYLPDKQLNQY